MFSIIGNKLVRYTWLRRFLFIKSRLGRRRLAAARAPAIPHVSASIAKKKLVLSFAWESYCFLTLLPILLTIEKVSSERPPS